MSQTIKIQADFVEKSDDCVFIKTQDTLFKCLSDNVIRIENSKNPLAKYKYSVTLDEKTEITAIETLRNSQNIVCDIFQNVSVDNISKNKSDCDCTTVCDFCFCTPQDCDCDCL